MSGKDFFFDFTDPAGQESGVDEGANSWLFGGGDDNGDGSVDGEAAAVGDPVQGGEGFELPVLKGQLFGTDNAGGNRDEAPLTLSQLMAEPNADFPFDLSYGATTSDYYQRDSTAEEEGTKSKSNVAAVAAAAMAEKAKSAVERGRQSSAHSSMGTRGDDERDGFGAKEPTKKGSSSAFDDARRKVTDDKGANIRSAEDSIDGLERENPFRAAAAAVASDPSKSPGNNANNKRVKWSGEVADLSGVLTSSAAKEGKSKSSETSQIGECRDVGGAGESGRKGSNNRQIGRGGGGGGRRRETGIGGGNLLASSKNNREVYPRGNFPPSGLSKPSRSGPGNSSGNAASGSVDSGSFGRETASNIMGRSSPQQGTDHRSPGLKQPLVMPQIGQMLNQQRQPQGILRQQQSQQGFAGRFGLDSPRPQPPPSRNSNARQALKVTSAERTVQGNNNGSENDHDASYHLARPIAATLDRVSAELKPVKALENALDQIIDHLDDLDAKCDAKLEDLMRKKKQYLDATKMLQSAFK